MRLHVIAALLVGLSGGGLRLGVAEELALVVCVFLVLAGEVLNTALEALVDLHTRELDVRARIAKDAAAGSVLVLSTGAALVLVAVLARAWPQLAAEPRRIGIHALLALPVAAAAALLVTPWSRRPRADAALAATGTVFLAALAPRFTSLAMGVLSAGAFALCAVVARARGRGV